MPILRILKGERRRDIVIADSAVSIGRKRANTIRLLTDGVSRDHAKIVAEDGRYYLVDVESHNGTYLNSVKIDPNTRYLLNHGDDIKICNYVFEFVNPESSSWRGMASDHSGDTVDIVEDAPDEDSGDSKPLPSSANSWEERVSINPEAKLKAIMQITADMQKTFSLDELLSRVLASLLRLFPDAECALIVFREEEDGCQVFPRRVLHRDPDCQDRVTASGTVIRNVMEGQRSLLVVDVPGDEDLKGHDSVYTSGLKSLICAPILDLDGRSLAAVQLDTRTKPHRFTEEDLDLLSMIVRLLSFSIEEVRLRITKFEQRSLQHDLGVAREIQLTMLPNALPDVSNYKFFNFYSPARQVGGDYYDYLHLPDGRIAVVVGDVSGKGVPAALLAAMTSSELRVFIASGLTPVEVLKRTNASYRARAPEGSLVTLAVVILDPRTHEVQIANAGHPRPLLVRQGQPPMELGDDEAGCPLGVLAEPEYGCCRFTLEKGDCLVLHTDGVTDAENAEEEMYELPRFKQLLAGASGDAEEIGRAIVTDVEEFVGRKPQMDDICIVCLSRTQ